MYNLLFIIQSSLFNLDPQIFMKLACSNLHYVGSSVLIGTMLILDRTVCLN